MSDYGNIRYFLRDYFFNMDAWSLPLVIWLSGIWICWWHIWAQGTHHPHSYCRKTIIQSLGIHQNHTSFNPCWAKTWVWTHFRQILNFQMNTNNQWLCWAKHHLLMLNEKLKFRPMPWGGGWWWWVVGGGCICYNQSWLMPCCRDFCQISKGSNNS